MTAPRAPIHFHEQQKRYHGHLRGNSQQVRENRNGKSAVIEIEAISELLHTRAAAVVLASGAYLDIYAEKKTHFYEIEVEDILLISLYEGTTFIRNNLGNDNAVKMKT